MRVPGGAGRVLKGIAYASIAAFVILDFVIPRRHVEFPWDDVPGFSAVYGFVSAVVIIIVAKGLGKWWLQKKENYYD
jgi:hypothetical protein